ncbi:nucleoporin-62 C-terminal-like protein [Ornithorhynchus anatinus]|nr:nucleoporin-62 C-terminal-like protein [Ornithorhynchus anatinus]
MSQFNFGTSGTTGGGFNFGTAKPATTTATTGFSFSTPGTGGGFSFGTPSQTPANTQSTSLFSLPTPAAATSTPGFSFGTPAATTPAPAATGFSLGVNTPKLNLGTTSTTQSTGITGGFGLGSSTLANSVPSGVPTSQAAAPASFGFGTTTAAAAATTVAPAQPTASTGFSFTSGGATQTGTTGFNISSIGNAAQPTALTGLTFAAAAPASTSAPSTTPALAFNLGGQSTGFGILASTATAAAPTGTLTTIAGQGAGLTFGAKLPGLTPATTSSTTTSGPTLFASITSSSTPASTSATSLSLGAPSTTTAGASGLGTLGFGLKVPGMTATTSSTASSTSSAPNTGFALNLKPLTTSGTATSVSSTGPSVPSAAPTATSTTPVMTYAQLESLINKWSLELEDQEKHFLHQATQVNAWDRTLIENGEKITSLHREAEKVKLDQKRLDQELDFILSQQKELEDLLTPLEESVKEQSGTIYLQHADEERERTYKLAENIDAQLKRMAQDLKDIIEHLNTSGGPADTSDPLQQICKILNAHMDSLQWIDQNSALLQRKVEEVTKVCESRRKEQERSFRITFD